MNIPNQSLGFVGKHQCAWIRYVYLVLWIGFFCTIQTSVISGQWTFQGNGAAGPGGFCVSVEDGINFRAGSVFAQEFISLNEDQLISTRITPGCRDVDGEGIVFLFQSIGPSAGSYQSTMGYRGLGPSIGIELDLEMDESDNDPPYDHMAIVANGNLDHDAPENLFGPIRILQGIDDIEDCKIRFMTIRWIAKDRQLEVWFDCELRISTILDISYLSNIDEIYWGLTAGVNDSGVIYTICPDYVEELTFERFESTCKGGSVRLESSRDDLEYQWFHNEVLVSEGNPRLEITALESTVYEVISRDGCFRRYREVFNIEVRPDSLPLDLGVKDTIICPAQSIELIANVEDAQYEWNHGPTGISTTVSAPGTYIVTATLNACTNVDSVEVRDGDIPPLDLGTDRILCDGSVLKLSTELDSRYLHLWNTGNETNVIFVDQPGVYSVDVFNECGITNDEIVVEFENCIPLYIPDSFTPNNDGVNDLFQIYSEEQGVFLEEWNIYGRWGSVIFRTTNRSFDEEIWWDGTSNGEEVIPGVYPYSIKISLPSGREVSAAGTLTLLN